MKIEKGINKITNPIDKTVETAAPPDLSITPPQLALQIKLP